LKPHQQSNRLHKQYIIRADLNAAISVASPKDGDEADSINKLIGQQGDTEIVLGTQ